MNKFWRCGIIVDMKKINIISIVWKEGKYYVAQCLNADVSSFGKTKSEAMKNLQEAIEHYAEDVPQKIQEIHAPSIVKKAFQYA